VLLSRFWDGWRESVAMVKPATVLAWHSKGFRLFWRWKSRKRRPGRPRISAEVRKLIVEMAEMNVGWGAPRIHGELLKLGINVSEITVSRYMPKRPPPAGSRQRWATFLRNHLHETLAIDFAVVAMAAFGILYVFFVLSLERRRVLHFNVTHHPTAKWTTQQVVEACAFDLPGRFLLRDNDKIYGTEFRDRVDGLGLEQIPTAFRSPWQNGFAERWIASLRKDCLDHVIAINECHLRRVIRLYVVYYHEDRTHLGLEKDAPEERPIEPREMGEVVAIPRVGGLHHRYSRAFRSAA
jgi:transposase InsO family protein